jgi:hypothetical protein
MRHAAKSCVPSDAFSQMPKKADSMYLPAGYLWYNAPVIDNAYGTAFDSSISSHEKGEQGNAF